MSFKKEICTPHAVGPRTVPHVGMRVLDFFAAWDCLEAAHPFGVTGFVSLFSQFGVGPDDCARVDRHLFLDLMNARRPEVRRIKVEGRRSRKVFWVYIDLRTSTIGFQDGPMHPFVLTTFVSPTPSAIVGAIVAYHELTDGCGTRPRIPCRRPPRTQ